LDWLQFLEEQWGYTGKPNSMAEYISAISFGGLTFDPQVGREGGTASRILEQEPGQSAASVTCCLWLLAIAASQMGSATWRPYKHNIMSLAFAIAVASCMPIIAAQDNVVVGPIPVPCTGYTGAGVPFDSKACDAQSPYAWYEAADDYARQVGNLALSLGRRSTGLNIRPSQGGTVLA
jgi:hypothetical protein